MEIVVIGEVTLSKEWLVRKLAKQETATFSRNSDVNEKRHLGNA